MKFEGGGGGGTAIPTSAQRKLLLRYREHRQKPFTAAGLLVPLLPRVALSVVLVAISFYISPRLALFVAGVLVGALLRQVALAVHGVRVLPVLLQVIDWQKVDQLLDEPVGDA